MPLPASILEILETKKVNYNITEMARPSKKLSVVQEDRSVSLVKSIIVQDGQGRMQVLIPSESMLDLDAMHRQLSRKFEGVPNSEIRPMILEHKLSSIPAIPRWQGMTTLVDSSLLKRDKLLLEAGDESRLLELDQEGFQEIISSATVGNFTTHVPELENDASKDEAQIFDSVKKFTQRRIKQRLDETLEFPPLPDSAQRIIKLRADPNADINDLTNIVEIDPSLAAQVVSWAASPYYSAPGKIKSVHDAIVRVLGFDMVLNLALGLALGKSLSQECLTKPQIAEYWRGAVYTAATVEGLVTKIARDQRPSFGMAYLSGLLNNFGYLVMAEVFPPYFHNIERYVNANPHVPPASIEQQLMSVTGAQVAAWLLENWNMPEEVVVALRQQNNPEIDHEHHVYPKLIFVAKQLLAKYGFGTNLGVPIPDSVFESLYLERETAEITVENILESGADLDEIADKMRG